MTNQRVTPEMIAEAKERVVDPYYLARAACFWARLWYG